MCIRDRSTWGSRIQTLTNTTRTIKNMRCEKSVNKPQKKLYRLVTDAERESFIKEVNKREKSMKEIAKERDIKLSTAKVIMKQFRREGRLHKRRKHKMENIAEPPVEKRVKCEEEAEDQVNIVGSNPTLSLPNILPPPQPQLHPQTEGLSTQGLLKTLHLRNRISSYF
eukprot:TRINITY_DN8573_c0_g1_i1.p1 TRINITY_DN8573_c0_g1~~TRINITY_DN8573_c0_g1_i1.p1  ORF type:complete len:168 (-),score=42.13 TRINITY_DN8573_c0_g1_i1:326-829(-)